MSHCAFPLFFMFMCVCMCECHYCPSFLCTAVLPSVCVCVCVCVSFPAECDGSRGVETISAAVATRWACERGNANNAFR
ncbi:hypothetical protein TCDM_03815 [Trypanosoma cruzi Dm28c]|uniref:Secreted protein n=1 Tax=Trypanosoma cruzi Dm28c TaxID=1416333 RepID=V5DJH3_TRYCR|nr:hypothetical protein TCDM_03815 [Trypanosoma cruzi Dm28c]